MKIHPTLPKRSKSSSLPSPIRVAPTVNFTPPVPLQLSRVREHGERATVALKPIGPGAPAAVAHVQSNIDTSPLSLRSTITGRLSDHPGILESAFAPFPHGTRAGRCCSRFFIGLPTTHWARPGARDCLPVFRSWRDRSGYRTHCKRPRATFNALRPIKFPLTRRLAPVGPGHSVVAFPRNHAARRL